MRSREAGLWLGFAGSQAVPVARSIESRNGFSRAIVTAHVNPKQAEVALVYLHGEDLDEELAGVESLYLGLSQAGRQVATGQTTVNVSNLVGVPELSPEELRLLLPERFRKSFSPPFDGIVRPTPRLWEEMLTVIAGKLPASGPQVGDLLRAAQAANIPRYRVEGGLEVFERDAVATVIQAWRGEAMRKRVLREAIPSSAPVASFLQNLQQVSIREDPQIIHDSNTFPAMEVVRRDVVGTVVLADGDDYLTILNCNRQPLETTLGVDLIYYNHHYDSFVLVQYKRMSDGPEGAEYRPVGDSNHQKEIDRMLAANAALAAFPQQTASVDTFRLSEAPFYLKLCEPKAKTALDAGMVSGMYVPLTLWTELLKSPVVRGPRGGIVVRWDNCSRRFSNGEFTALLRAGWIGSAAGRTQALSDIIEQELQGKNMVIVGATSPRSPSRDYRRDGFGRFAPEDGPDAAM